MVDKLMNTEMNAKRIANVEHCFGMSGVPLGVPGRVLVGEGVLTKICRKKPKSRQFFLFNDILVYGLVIEDLPDEVIMKNGWLIKTTSKSFAVYAGSNVEKIEWIRHIQKSVDDLLIQTGRKAPLEHAAVWIPDSIAKVCMNCNITQFTMINRRHHCRKCGACVCNNCSKNRVVILAQSRNPVRICDTCYNKFHDHLKAKKPSTCSVHSPNTSPQATTTSQQQLISDAAEIKQAVKTCIETPEEDRDKEWVKIIGKPQQVTEHLKSTQSMPADNSDSSESISEATEAIKLDDLPKETESKSAESYHNIQTSDSEDEHNDLSGSVEDILDETHEKPTFYDQMSREVITEDADLTNGVSNAKGEELQKVDDVIGQIVLSTENEILSPELHNKNGLEVNEKDVSKENLKEEDAAKVVSKTNEKDSNEEKVANGLENDKKVNRVENESEADENSKEDKTVF